MANPNRVKSLIDLAEEDLRGARTLLDGSTRLARYHVQQCAEKAVKALMEHRNLNPGREHRFNMLAERLSKEDPWRGRINSLDALSPVATTHRYPTTEGRILPEPKRSLVESEIATVGKLLEDVKKEVAAAPAQTRYQGQTPVASEAERKLALARKLVSIARLRQLDIPDDAAEKLTIYADERTLSNLVKEIQTASSFQDALDAHSVTIPKNDNT